MIDNMKINMLSKSYIVRTAEMKRLDKYVAMEIIISFINLKIDHYY